MKRNQIRYALFRCKAGTADSEQLAILSKYKDQLDELGLTINEFAKEWDVDKKDLSSIVTGKVARKYNEITSLFTSDGTLKE